MSIKVNQGISMAIALFSKEFHYVIIERDASSGATLGTILPAFAIHFYGDCITFWSAAVSALCTLFFLNENQREV